MGLAAFGLLRLGLDRAPWSGPRVIVAMGLALRRLLVFTATLALLAGTRPGAAVAVCILLGFPLSHAMRRVFPPS